MIKLSGCSDSGLGFSEHGKLRYWQEWRDGEKIWKAAFRGAIDRTGKRMEGAGVQ